MKKVGKESHSGRKDPMHPALPVELDIKLRNWPICAETWIVWPREVFTFRQIWWKGNDTDLRQRLDQEPWRDWEPPGGRQDRHSRQARSSDPTREHYSMITWNCQKVNASCTQTSQQKLIPTHVLTSFTYIICVLSQIWLHINHFRVQEKAGS